MGCASGHADGRVVFCSACGFSRFDEAPARQGDDGEED
jgi:hypothetical protein